MLYDIIYFKTFSMSYDCVICDCDICDHTETCVTITHNITSHPLPKFKNKEKIKIKIKER